jgi:hypothetical protein
METIMNTTAYAVETRTVGFINGWNSAEIIGFKDFQGEKGKFTTMKFKISEKSEYPEEVYITDNEDRPLFERCKMIIEACGGKVPEGTTPAALEKMLQKCIGHKVALLLTRQKNKAGKMFSRVLHTNEVPMVKPLAAVGELYDTPTPVENKVALASATSEDALPGWK